MKKSNSNPKNGLGSLSRLLLLLVVPVALAQVRPAAEVANANLPAQRIGASDLIAVSVYDAPELTRTVRVGADGFMRLPMLKQRIKAEGLMPGELETAIASALVAEGLIVDPFRHRHHRRIQQPSHLRGGRGQAAAHLPGVGPVTLLEAITSAGGLAPEAGPEILVSRAQSGPDGSVTALVQRILVKGLIDAADPAMNISLTGGEEIRVPEPAGSTSSATSRKPGAFPCRTAWNPPF